MNILLLAGGESAEREVSLSSSFAIHNSLMRLGHTIDVFDPAIGSFLQLGMNGFESAGEPPPDKFLKQLAWRFDPKTEKFSRYDLVFIGLHGGLGENGSVQNLLDMVPLPYTGSGMVSSVVAMNKDISKNLMKSIDIPTPAWSCYKMDGSRTVAEIASEIKQVFDLPIVVKPADGGSTVGLSKVVDWNELEAAISTAAAEGNQVLVETFIEGREITAAVLDGEALPLVEIVSESGLYDYTAKYTPGKSNYIVPAGIDENLARQVRLAASSFYRLIGASGAARVDFRMTEAGMFYCLELNTLPGMTELSLVPMAAEAVGMSFDSLIERILDSAVTEKRVSWAN